MGVVRCLFTTRFPSISNKLTLSRLYLTTVRNVTTSSMSSLVLTIWETMVCVPCFIVPVLLLLWRFILWPVLRPLYIRFYPETDQKKSNETVEKLDKLGDDGCPFGCPLKPKEKTVVEEKKVL